MSIMSASQRKRWELLHDITTGEPDFLIVGVVPGSVDRQIAAFTDDEAAMDWVADNPRERKLYRVSIEGILPIKFIPPTPAQLELSPEQF